MFLSRTLLAACAMLVAANCASAVTANDSKALPKIYAHRGGGWAPENTMAAFKKCVENGVYGIELDIQRCKSGELIVIHDVDVKRTAGGGSGLVKDMTWDQLKGLDAGAWFAPEFKGERIPLLSEVLDTVGEKLVINIEIKNTPVAYPGIDDDLIKVLKNYKHKDKIVISSFDHEVLKRIHAKEPGLKLGFLMCGLPADLPAYAKELGTTAWHPDLGSVRPDTLKSAQSAGVEVNVWTLNTKDDWDHATKMHVDGIITDDPVAVATFLKGR
jgi:glycerophosphoryl diester phosphodiesterase